MKEIDFFSFFCCCFLVFGFVCEWSFLSSELEAFYCVLGFAIS